MLLSTKLERLQNLLRIAEALPVDTCAVVCVDGKEENTWWDQARWLQQRRDSHGTDQSDYFESRGIPHACNTTACLAGHAGLDPWFVARGLRTGTRIGAVLLAQDDDGFGEEVASFLMLGRWFGLGPEQTEALFHPVGTGPGENRAATKERLVWTIKSYIDEAMREGV